MEKRANNSNTGNERIKFKAEYFLSAGKGNEIIIAQRYIKIEAGTPNVYSLRSLWGEY